MVCNFLPVFRDFKSSLLDLHAWNIQHCFETGYFVQHWTATLWLSIRMLLSTIKISRNWWKNLLLWDFLSFAYNEIASFTRAINKSQHDLHWKYLKTFQLFHSIPQKHIYCINIFQYHFIIIAIYARVVL